MYKPVYRITPYLLNLIDEAARLCSWIEFTPLKVSWLPVLQKEARTRAAHFSTSIEGNPLTLSQVQAIARGEKTNAHHTHEREIHNYLKAMHWIEKNSGQEINEKNLLLLHKLLMEGLVPENKIAHYKQKQNYVIKENGIRIFTPPSPKDTPRHLRDLLAWINSSEASALHSIMVCAIFHHRFVSIHPFSDGNGRLARTTGTFILYQREFDLHYIFNLDEFFAADRKRYYQKIQQARELDDNLTLWIEYVAEGVVYTLKNVKKRIEDLHVSSLCQISLTPRQEEALRILRDHPPLRVGELTHRLKITRSRINQLLTPLIQAGLVKKSGKSRATTYNLNV